jgi:hypothetical protein
VALMAERDTRGSPPAAKEAPAEPRPDLRLQQSVRTAGGITYALSATRGFLVSFDLGSTWIERNQGLSRRMVYPFTEDRVRRLTSLGVDPAHEARVAVTAASELFLSEDYGSTWVKIPWGKPLRPSTYFTAVALPPMIQPPAGGHLLQRLLRDRRPGRHLARPLPHRHRSIEPRGRILRGDLRGELRSTVPGDALVRLRLRQRVVPRRPHELEPGAVPRRCPRRDDPGPGHAASRGGLGPGGAHRRHHLAAGPAGWLLEPDGAARDGAYSRSVPARAPPQGRGPRRDLSLLHGPRRGSEGTCASCRRTA